MHPSCQHAHYCQPALLLSSSCIKPATLQAEKPVQLLQAFTLIGMMPSELTLFQNYETASPEAKLKLSRGAGAHIRCKSSWSCRLIGSCRYSVLEWGTSQQWLASVVCQCTGVPVWSARSDVA